MATVNITNLTNSEVIITGIFGLIPKKTTRTYENITVQDIEAARPSLVRLKTNGIIAYDVTGSADPDDDDLEFLPGGGGGGGSVVGPVSSTNNAITRWSGATGEILKNSTVLVSDLGDIIAPGSLTVNSITVSGNVDGRDISTDGSKLDTIETNADVTDAANVAAAGAVMDSDFTGTNVGALRRTGVGTYAVLQDNLTAVVDPTTSADSASGYSVGSLWVNTLTNQVFICADAGVGAAVWRQNGGGVTDHGALTGLADDDHTQYLLVNGTRAMTGDLDMGGQDVSNVGTVDGRDVSADGTKLDTIETNADVTDATNVAAAGAVMESDYTPAHSLLVQQSGTGSPSPLSVGNNTILGRASGGGSPIAALSAASVKTILDYQGSEVDFTPNGDIAATDVQAAIVEVRNDTDTKLGSKVDLAGQLGGTAASPDVRGVRETGGPTLLTMGAVGDGEYFRRSGTSVVGGIPGGGSTFRGIRGFTLANYLEVATPADLAGNASPGFEIYGLINVDGLLRGSLIVNNYIASTASEFVGPGYHLWLQGDRPRHSVTDGGGTLLSNFLQEWLLGTTFRKPLIPISMGFNGTTRFLKVAGQTIFSAAMTGYTPSVNPFRVGRPGGSATSGALENATLFALAAKTDGILTDAEHEEALRVFLATGDLPNGVFTSRWSFASLSVGAVPATVSDAIGSNDLTLVGSLSVVDDKFSGLALVGDPASTSVKIGGQIGGSTTVPDIRGVRETSGPTLLTFGAIADGQFFRRSGATAVGGDPVLIGGQLGGTAASPDVRGIRETSGPTLLTLGAIADGEYARRVGSTLVGGNPSGGAVNFDAVRGFSGSDYMTATTSDYQGDPTGYSLAVLARPRRRDPIDSVLLHTANTFINHTGYLVGWQVTQGFYFSSGDGVSAPQFILGPSSLYATAGKLCLLHCIFDGTNTYGAVNGSRAAGGAASSFVATGIAPVVGLGPFGIAEAADFEILGVAYLTGVLTDDQIIDHWTAVADARAWVDGGIGWDELNGGALAPGWPSLNGGSTTFSVTGTLSDTEVPPVWR